MKIATKETPSHSVHRVLMSVDCVVAAAAYIVGETLPQHDKSGHLNSYRIQKLEHEHGILAHPERQSDTEPINPQKPYVAATTTTRPPGFYTSTNGSIFCVSQASDGSVIYTTSG